MQGDVTVAVYKLIVNFMFNHAVFGLVGPYTSSEANFLSPLISKLYKRPMVRFAVLVHTQPAH